MIIDPAIRAPDGQPDRAGRHPGRRTRWLAVLFAALLAACAQDGATARGPFPGFAQYEGRPVTEVSFGGEVVLPVDSLHAVTLVRPPHCKIRFLPGWACFVGRETYELDLAELAGDVLRLQLYHRDHGYYGTRVVPAVEPSREGAVAVRFAIVPGDRVMLRELEVEGMEGVVPPEEIRGRLPLAVDEPFRRVGYLAGADTLRSLLYRRGYAYAEILRNYDIDTIADVARVQYVAAPGPLVRVDSVRVLGASGLDRGTILKQLTVREGQLLAVPELARSQRNLYQLAIISFASVEIAPDSLQVDPDSTTATVVVRVVEAAKYLADATLGFGTVDCLRAGSRLVDRNFLGGGRTLELSASSSKIGVGALGGTCKQPNLDPVGQVLNYRLAADFVQPRLLGTRTQLSSNVHLERQSELGLYLRRSVGGQLLVSREVARNLLVGTGLQVERGSTRATNAIFCVVFTACSEEEQDPLQRSRWSNAATASAVWDRTRQAGLSIDGFQVRSNVALASPLLASDDDYLSVTGEVVGYRTLRPGWIAAARIHGGEFLNGSLGVRQGFIPPERRFYAGGPNSVRGFPVNALGPQAYVTPEVNYDLNTGRVDEEETEIRSSPLGGTRIAVASAELRMPSPVLAQYLRWAAFVDAGQVWAPGLEAQDQLLGTGRGNILVTPGVGVRITTPVGPIRIDAAYNPYRARPGPLYEAPEERGVPTGTLELLDPDFAPTSLVRRLQFHIAVGQAF